MLILTFFNALIFGEAFSIYINYFCHVFQLCFFFTRDVMVSDDGDIESLASSDVMVLDQEGKGVDEETDLSLASSPSLPDDLPAIKLVFLRIYCS